MTTVARRNLAHVLAPALMLLALTPAGAAPIPVTSQVLDDPGQGFNDSVLGTARQEAFRVAADRWGSFFEQSDPGQTVDVGIRYEPLQGNLQDFVAFTFVLVGRPDPSANFVTTITHAENLYQTDFSGSLLHAEIIFNERYDFFLGQQGNPGNQDDFVTYAPSRRRTCFSPRGRLGSCSCESDGSGNAVELPDRCTRRLASQVVAFLVGRAPCSVPPSTCPDRFRRDGQSPTPGRSRGRESRFV